MLILGSCLALNLEYPGCCVFRVTPPCRNNGCYCDHKCHILNDCCSDIGDIGCYLANSSSSVVSPTPTDTLGKTITRLYNTLSTASMKFTEDSLQYTSNRFYNYGIFNF